MNDFPSPRSRNPGDENPLDLLLDLGPKPKKWEDSIDEFFPDIAKPLQKAAKPEPAIGGAFNRGAAASARGLYSTQYTLGMMDDNSFIRNVLASEADEKRYPPTENLKRQQQLLAGGSFSPLLDPEFVTSSIGESIPASIATAGLATTLGGAGSLLGPIGTIGGAGAGIFLGSGADEYGRSFLDYLKKESKVQEWDEHTLRLALANEPLVKEAIWYAAKRGGLIGAFDAAAAGLGGTVASKLLTAPTRWSGAKAAAAGIGIEGTGGSLGEASAQAVTEDQMNWASVAAEGVLELAAGAPEVAVATKLAGRAGGNGKFVAPPPSPQGQTAPIDLDELIKTVTQPDETPALGSGEGIQPLPDVTDEDYVQEDEEEGTEASPVTGRIQEVPESEFNYDQSGDTEIQDPVPIGGRFEEDSIRGETDYPVSSDVEIPRVRQPISGGYPEVPESEFNYDQSGDTEILDPVPVKGRFEDESIRGETRYPVTDTLPSLPQEEPELPTDIPSTKVGGEFIEPVRVGVDIPQTEEPQQQGDPPTSTISSPQEEEFDDVLNENLVDRAKTANDKDTLTDQGGAKFLVSKKKIDEDEDGNPLFKTTVYYLDFNGNVQDTYFTIDEYGEVKPGKGVESINKKRKVDPEVLKQEAELLQKNKEFSTKMETHATTTKKIEAAWARLRKKNPDAHPHELANSPEGEELFSFIAEAGRNEGHSDFRIKKTREDVAKTLDNRYLDKHGDGKGEGTPVQEEEVVAPEDQIEGDILSAFHILAKPFATIQKWIEAIQNNGIFRNKEANKDAITNALLNGEPYSTVITLSEATRRIQALGKNILRPRTKEELGLAIRFKIEEIIRAQKRGMTAEAWIKLFKESPDLENVNWADLEDTFSKATKSRGNVITRGNALSAIQWSSASIYLEPVEQGTSAIPGEVEDVQTLVVEDEKNILLSFHTTDRTGQSGEKILLLEDINQSSEEVIDEAALTKIITYAKDQGYASISFVQTLGGNILEGAQRVARNLGLDWDLVAIHSLEEGDQNLIQAPAVLLSGPPLKVGEKVTQELGWNPVTFKPLSDLAKSELRRAKKEDWIAQIETIMKVATRIMNQFRLSVPLNIEFYWNDLSPTDKGNASWKNNEFKIIINIAKSQNITDLFATLMHEFGHVIAFNSWDRAPVQVKNAINAAFQEYRRKNNLDKGERPQDLAELAQRTNPSTMQMYQSLDAQRNVYNNLDDPAFFNYYFSFSEWFAEQVSKWAQTDQKPLSIIDKFFHNLARKLKTVLASVSKFFGVPQTDFNATAIMRDWLNSFLTDVDPLSIQEIENRTWRQSYDENKRALVADPDFKNQKPYAARTAAMAMPMISKVFGGRSNVPPSVAATAAASDRWNALYRQFAGIQRLAELNSHIRQFGQLKELFQLAHVDRQNMMDKALETIKKWDKLSTVESDNMMKMLEEYTTMKFLPPHQRSGKGKVMRKPTRAELTQMIARHNVSPAGVQVFLQIAKDFDDFLTIMEAEALREAQSIKDTTKRAARVQAIQTQYQALRKVPYFPLMRYGEFTVTVYNTPTPGPKRRILEFSTAESLSEQKKLARSLERKYAGRPGVFVQSGKLAKESVPLLGMPRTMLDAIGRRLNLSKVQIDALDQLKIHMSPENSFAHRFQHRTLKKGYSLDFKRSYAKYFFNGSGYVVRTRYMKEMRALVGTLRRTKHFMRDANDRDSMANFLAETIDIWADPKPDWVAPRTLGFLWFIAGSPAAAALNLTQMALTTYPLLASNFGDIAAVREIGNAGRRLSTFYKKGSLPPPVPGTTATSEMEALGEAVRLRIIEEGQAIELASMAEGNNLNRRSGHDKLSKGWNHIITAGSFLHRMSEQLTRRVTFRAAWALAQQQPNAKFVNESVQMEKIHYDRLVNSGWLPKDAAAFVTAKRAVENSQFMYTSSYLPRIMTGGRGSNSRGFRRTILMFKNFVIQSLFFAHNPHDKGASIRYYLVLAYMGGLMGLPFAEDMSELIRSLAWAIFGKELNLESEARKLILEIAGEDSPAADIALNGTSRIGFGIPQMMDFTGWPLGLDVPMPSFDMSKNISMGQISPVPLGILGPQKSPEAAIARSAERASGPVGGFAFNFFKFLTDSQIGVDDPKKWERILPRAIKDVSQSYRAFSEGIERTPDGTAIATFNPGDTEQFLEMIGIGMGFTPTRLSAKYDLIAAEREVNAYWDLRREAIMRQYKEAIRGKDPDEIKDVVAALLEYNASVPKEFAGKRIQKESLRKSVRESTRMRIRKERGLGANRSQQGVSQELRKQHPLAPGAIEVESRRVR